MDTPKHVDVPKHGDVPKHRDAPNRDAPNKLDTPYKLRAQARLYLQAARREAAPELKRLLASHAQALDQLATRIEGEGRDGARTERRLKA